MSLAIQAGRSGARPSPPRKGGGVADHVQPHSIEAEQSTLGAMLIEADAIRTAAGILCASDFYRGGHQTLFDVFKFLADRGDPVDLITVPAELRNREKMEDVGGLGYLTSLFDTVPTAANVEFYARIVEKKSVLRALISVNLEIAHAAMADDADLAVLLRRQEQLSARLSERVAGGGLTRRKSFAETIITFRDIPPPPSELPYLFGPYLNTGAAHWLTGQTGIGKSTWLYNVLPALAEGAELWSVPCQPTRILYFDMESGDLGRSMKASRLFPDRAAVTAFANLFVQGEPPRFPSDVRAMLSFIQAQGISLVVFDTARRCFSIKDENDNAEVYRQIVPILDELKALGVASLTMGHPAKNGNGSARGAGAQEDAGDVNLNLTMHRGEVTEPDGVIALRVTKNRLLGLGIPPLLLRRAGGDLFEHVEMGEAGAQEEPLSKQLQCRQFVLDTLQGSVNAIAHGTLLKMAEVSGFKKATFDRAFKRMKDEGDLAASDGGYTLSDPFAD